MAQKKKAKKKPNKQKNIDSKPEVKSESKSESKPEIKESKSESKAAEKKSDSSAKTDKKSSDKKPEKKPSVFSKIAKYFRECRSEIKKIVWPTPKTTFRNMGIVIAVLIVIGLFVYGLDTGLVALLGLIMDIGSNA